MMDNFLMNTYKRVPVKFIKGDGIWLYSSHGKKYLDFITGIGVVSLGHGSSEIADVICKQSKSLTHVSNLYFNEPQLQLAKKLSELSLGGKVFFANSGAEANEAAIKLARKHGKEKLGGAYKIISFENSFHGRTLGAIAATAQLEKQEPFKPMLEGFEYVPLNNIQAFKEKADDGICAVLIELIQGEGGVNVIEKEFIKAVEKFCKENNVLLIVDEVQTGIGKTGTLFAYQQYNIKPNMITLAKALANGLPIGALVADKNASEIFVPGDHASTFGGGAVVCSAALKVLEIIEKDDLLEHVKSMGDYFDKKLKLLIKKYEIIDKILGIGLMKAIKLKEDLAEKITYTCFENGLLVNNVKPNIVRFLPPLIVTKKDIDTAIGILDKVITNV